MMKFVMNTLSLSILTQDCLYHHPVHKISFIAQDMSDSRAFGYIFGSPDTGHRFFGIKTDKAASQVSARMSFISRLFLSFSQVSIFFCFTTKLAFIEFSCTFGLKNRVTCALNKHAKI